MNKKIILFDPKPLIYRINNYEYFIDQFNKEEYSLNILYDIDRVQIHHENYIGIKYSPTKLMSYIIKNKPKVCILRINFEYRWLLIFIVLIKLLTKSKVIVWSKVVNIKNPKSKFKNILYLLRQYCADSLIIYSDYEKKFVRNKNKMFIANNTINEYKYKKYLDIESIKNELNIKYEKCVLFVGRFEKRKKVDLLFDIFANRFQNICLLLVGPKHEYDDRLMSEGYENIIELGPIYNMDKLSKIFSIADVFCIPGHIGLGVNEAFMYGIPVITEYIYNKKSLISSEPYMLIEDGINGYYYDGTKEDLNTKMELLLYNDYIRKEMSKNARKKYEDTAKIEYMFNGFMKSVEYVQKKHDNE